MYSMGGQNIEEVEDTPYLGIHLNKSLKWNNHINIITAKANRILGLLRRNMRHTPRAVKETAYNTLVRPRLEYCSAIWSPYTAELKFQLEKVQRGAARFVLGRPYQRGSTESVAEMLRELQWETLERRRNISALTFIYKMTNDLIEIPKKYHPIPLKTPTRHTNEKAFQTYQPRVDCFKYSLLPRTVPSWNLLSTEVVSAPTLDTFKSGVNKIL